MLSALNCCADRADKRCRHRNPCAPHAALAAPPPLFAAFQQPEQRTSCSSAPFAFTSPSPLSHTYTYAHAYSRIRMDVTLSRLSIAPHNVSSSYPSTFALLKLSKGKPQKAVYGSDDGCLTCFSIKKGQVVVVFRTAPGPAPVSCVHVHVTPDGKDRIFFAVGRSFYAAYHHSSATNVTRHSVITGVSKKGKIFKTLDCATYDVIRSMHFAANRLLVADLRSCK